MGTLTAESTPPNERTQESRESTGVGPETDLRLLICVTGSLYATQIPGHVMRLRRYLTDDVRVAMTPASERFISAETMRQYLAGKVYTDAWDTFEDGRPAHIGLTKWADCMLVMPMSANSLAKLAGGVADNLVAELMVASDPRVTALAPAMNHKMWSSPSVKRNLQTVTSDGFTVLGTLGAPEVGRPAGPVDGVAPEPSNVLAWLRQMVGRLSHSRRPPVD